MIDLIWYLVGILFVLLGIAVSIALHELGHLWPAKKFGVKVTQYMIGFGPTVWSRHRGDTEYGIKAVPLGGYIAMIGMFPPAKPGKRVWSKKWANWVVSARRSQLEQFGPDEDKRNFWQLPVYKRIIIMLGGPFANLVLGVLFTTIAVSGIGIYGPTTTIQTVADCKPLNALVECAATDPKSPAALAGFKAGDRIVSIGGKPTTVWTDLATQLRPHVGHTVSVRVERDGKQLELQVQPAMLKRPVVDATGQAYKLNSAGKPILIGGPYLGVNLKSDYVPAGFDKSLQASWASVAQVGQMLAVLPQKVGEVAMSTFGGGERKADTPVSIVGIGQIAGEVASNNQVRVIDKVAMGLGILASLNFALFGFNLIPLLPLDGGHVAGALYEGVRRFFAKLFRRKDPGPVDTSQLVPLTTFMWAILLAMGLLFIVADVVNPIKLGV